MCTKQRGSVMPEASADFVELSADVVAAYVSNNSVTRADLPALISTVHAALKHAAIALWYVSTSNYEAFKDYVTEFEGDLTPEQRSHLTDLGIDPDRNPD